MTLRFYATGIISMWDLCQIAQPSASRNIKRVLEVIARLKNNYSLGHPVPRASIGFGTFNLVDRQSPIVVDSHKIEY